MKSPVYAKYIDLTTAVVNKNNRLSPSPTMWTNQVYSHLQSTTLFDESQRYNQSYMSDERLSPVITQHISANLCSIQNENRILRQLIENHTVCSQIPQITPQQSTYQRIESAGRASGQNQQSQSTKIDALTIELSISNKELASERAKFNLLLQKFELLKSVPPRQTLNTNIQDSIIEQQNRISIQRSEQLKRTIEELEAKLVQMNLEVKAFTQYETRLKAQLQDSLIQLDYAENECKTLKAKNKELSTSITNEINNYQLLQVALAKERSLKPIVYAQGIQTDPIIPKKVQSFSIVVQTDPEIGKHQFSDQRNQNIKENNVTTQELIRLQKILELKLTSAKEDTFNLSQKNQKQEIKIASLQEQSKDYEAQLIIQNVELKNYQDLYQTAQQTIQDLQSQINDRKNTRTERQSLSNREKELGSANTQLLAQIAQLNIVNKELRDKLYLTQAENIELNEDIQTLIEDFKKNQGSVQMKMIKISSADIQSKGSIENNPENKLKKQQVYRGKKILEQDLQAKNQLVKTLQEELVFVKRQMEDLLWNQEQMKQQAIVSDIDGNPFSPRGFETRDAFIAEIERIQQQLNEKNQDIAILIQHINDQQQIINGLQPTPNEQRLSSKRL